jgi:NAD kinase
MTSPTDPASGPATRAGYEKIVVITRKTRLENLQERFNTRGQARFYIEQQKENFAANVKNAAPALARKEAAEAFRDYETEQDVYRSAIGQLLNQLEKTGLEVQLIDRTLVPTFLFSRHDIILTLGQDGLVANCAKYVGAQPIIGVNPDPERFDGTLLPFSPEQAPQAVRALIAGSACFRDVTLAEAVLNDGQRLLAFNDLFIGPQTHVSARYRIAFGAMSENQSSSGVIVSTGVGSSGWMSSLFNMATGLASASGGKCGPPPQIRWEDRKLFFAVREPFVSHTSSANLVSGVVTTDRELEMESQMPTGGVIFSDGIEADSLAFNSGTIATIRPARQYARLVVSGFRKE